MHINQEVQIYTFIIKFYPEDNENFDDKPPHINGAGDFCLNFFH